MLSKGKSAEVRYCILGEVKTPAECQQQLCSQAVLRVASPAVAALRETIESAGVFPERDNQCCNVGKTAKQSSVRCVQSAVRSYVLFMLLQPLLANTLLELVTVSDINILTKYIQR